MTPEEQKLYDQSYIGQVKLLRARVLALVPWPLRPMARLYLDWCRRRA